jgi:HEPN superfamily AbiU2-like protein
MSRNRSAEEVQQEHLAGMGQTLGPVYHVLYEEVVWLHAKWLEYRKLYGHSEPRVDFLNSMARFFFRVLHDVLWDDIVLHIARLTDPPTTVGKENLTLLRLPAVIPDAALAADTQSMIDAAGAQWSFARDWRNRRLAHRDLALALDAAVTPLTAVSREHVERALKSIRAILNRVHRHYLKSQVAFEHFISRDDADTLIYHLRVAKMTEERRRDRLRRGVASPEDLERPPEV